MPDDKLYCSYCSEEVSADSKQCSRCNLIFKPEYVSPNTPPAYFMDEKEKESKYFCINCWSFREVDGNSKCVKCGSGSVLDRDKYGSEL